MNNPWRNIEQRLLDSGISQADSLRLLNVCENLVIGTSIVYGLSDEEAILVFDVLAEEMRKLHVRLTSEQPVLVQQQSTRMH